MESLTSVLGCSSAILRARSRESSILSPFTAMITSPALMFSLAAGPSSATLVTIAPLASDRPIEIGYLVRHILDDDAEPTAIDGAMLLQLTDHLLDESRRHREGDPDAAARRREDRGVHTDDLAIKIEGRTARIAAVHRCIDLQVVIRTRANVPVVGRDDSASHRAAETEGIADREHPVANAGVLVGELHVGELLGSLDLEERHVGASIGPN